MPTLILVRHTAVGSPPGTCYGQTDVDLHPEHPAHLADVALRLRPLLAGRAYRLVSSPLSRCARLADHVAAELGYAQAVERVPALAELHFGQWENLPWAELPEEPLNAWMADFCQVAPPGGETYDMLQARAFGFVEGWAAQADNDAVLVAVSHSGPIRAVVAGALGLPLANAFRLSAGFGSIALLEKKGPLWSLSLLGG